MKVLKNQLALNMNDERLIWFLLLVVLAISSCGDSDPYSGMTGLIEELPQLPEPYEYSMWLNENGNSRQMTTFNADEEGVFRLAAAPNPMFITDASEIIVSVENGDEAYLEPSNKQVLGARFSGGERADFSTYPICADFSIAEAAFTVHETEQFELIILRFEPNRLKLPALNEEWLYEYWVEKDGVFQSMGRYQDFSAPETLYSTEELYDKMVWISVEPIEDFSEDPSGIFIFSKEVESTINPEQMQLLLESLPKGVVNKEE